MLHSRVPAIDACQQDSAQSGEKCGLGMSDMMARHLPSPIPASQEGLNQAGPRGGTDVRLTISIVIIGDQPLVVPCLESIEAQTTVEYEIWLVENLASGLFLEQILERFPTVRLIRSPKLRSFAENHNEVLRRSNADLVLLLNDDTVILDHALDQLVEFLASQPEEVGLAGCTNLTRDGELALSCYPFPSAGLIVAQHAELERVLPGRAHQRYLAQAKGSEPFLVDWVQGSCMLIRREVIQEIGYLDPGFFLFSEEVDYCYRARWAGFSVCQVPQAQIIHHESATTRHFVPLKLRGHYLGSLYFLAKHGFRRDLVLVRAWFMLELITKSLIRGVGVLVGHPPDARVRLQAYLDLFRICATYRGQPAATLISRES